MLPAACKCNWSGACAPCASLPGSALFLFGCPGKVFCQLVILSELFDGVELSGQCHFVVNGMNALVAGTADKNALIQHVAVVVLLEITAPVNLARNQVMKGQRQFPEAQAAGLRPIVAGVCGNIVRRVVSAHIRDYAWIM